MPCPHHDTWGGRVHTVTVLNADGDVMAADHDCLCLAREWAADLGGLFTTVHRYDAEQEALVLIETIIRT
jgi:hypothetical protein